MDITVEIGIIHNTIMRYNNDNSLIYSVMGRNIRLMESRFGMEEYNMCEVWEVWEQKCDNVIDAERLCVS